MSTCVDKMIIEDEHELTPQLKRMKLNSNEIVSKKEISRSSFYPSSAKDQLRLVFPYINEEKLSEILEKSSQNIEEAQKTIHEMRMNETKENKDFINLNTNNRKRGFNQMVKFQENANSNENQNQSVVKRIKGVKSNKNAEIKTENSESEIDLVIDDLSKIKTREEIKIYLKIKINELANQKKEKDDVKNLEKLINDNNSLKKTVVCLYRKYEEIKSQVDENQTLKMQVEAMKQQLIKEKNKNQTMAMLLRQYDLSNMLDFQNTENIY